jgi:cardiolipin synthase A/B
MLSPLHREETVDLTKEPLGAGWLRRHPTKAEAREVISAGVWRTGPQLRFRQELVTALDAATEIVLLSSFLLADERLADAMLRAAQRGVRVYVLTASEQRIGKVVRDDETFEQRMADQHKKLLERLAGNVRLRSAEHIHAKFLVIDPRSPTGARAWISTANFNKALEDSIELGVKLDAAGARALAVCFQWAFWCEAERELRGARRLIEIRPQQPAAPARPADDAVFATLRDGTHLRDRAVALIRGARHEILVASYGIAADHVAVRALIDAAKRGVRVTVLTRPRRAVAAGVAALASAGIAIFAHDKLHAKAIVADGQALVMSANLEAQGLDRGFEIGAILTPTVARGVEETLRDWANAFPWVYRANATRGDHAGDFCPADAALRDGTMRVTDIHSQRLPSVVAEDALRLGDAPTPALKPSPERGEMPRKVSFIWDVLPPSLPKGAAERLQEIEREETDKDGKPKTGKDGKPRKIKSRISYDPPVFEHGGNVYVVLRRSDDMERARQVAADLGARVVLP